MHESIVLSFRPPTRIAHTHTVAILLHNYWATYDPLSTSFLYVIHHTILVRTISCKGQHAHQRGRPLASPSPTPLRYRWVNPKRSWPLQDIVIINIVWCTACKPEVGREAVYCVIIVQ